MKAKTLLESFKFALQGIAYTFATQRNFRLHSLASILVVVSAFGLRLSVPEIMAVITAAFAVLVAELINTAIEKTIDMFTVKYHPLAKIAKNCAAGAVLFTACYAIIIALFIYLPALFRFFW
jgi:diacylglycerol kinase